MGTIIKLIVRYAETDQMGIVHHSNYPIWYEAARTEFTKSIGMSYSEFEKIGIILPLIGMESRFIKPAFYEDEIKVEVKLVRMTQVKMDFAYRVFRAGDDKPINTGKTFHGIVGKDMKPLMLKRVQPELYVRLLNKCESEFEDE